MSLRDTDRSMDFLVFLLVCRHFSMLIGWSSNIERIAFSYHASMIIVLDFECVSLLWLGTPQTSESLVYSFCLVIRKPGSYISLKFNKGEVYFNMKNWFTVTGSLCDV